MKTLLSLLLLCTMTLHCASPPKAIDDPAHLPQIIFVPGYYGSFLKRKIDNKRIWFGIGQALWGGQTLALSEDGIEVPDAVEMEVDGVFDSLDLIPGILSKDIYGKIIAALEQHFSGQATIVPFAYDWRRDITRSSRHLAQLVDKLYAQGAPKVAIVSHSMGGLITSYYLLYGKQKLKDAQLNLDGANKLHAVVMAATPFQGTMSIFYDMQYGVSFGLNKKALESAAVASFPSSYQLLPQYPESLLSISGNNLSQWLFEEDRWQTHGWSLFRKGRDLDTETLINRQKFTRKMLLLGKTTHKKIHNYETDLTSKVPFLYFFSGDTATLNQAIWVKKEKTLFFPGKNLGDSPTNFNNKQMASPGDGTVTKVSAQTPERFDSTFLNLEKRNQAGEHLELLQQDKTIGEIVQFLQKALDLGLGSSK